MAERQRLPLPYGGGLDRATGAMSAQPQSFNDLRNVHLSNGRTELRRGLARALVLPAPWTDLLGVYLVRAQGLAGAIGYNAATREVGLFAVDSSGTDYAFIATLWTIPAGATSPPRISATDQYDRLIIAHDEPVYPLRQATMVYSAIEATVSPLMLDLGRTGTPEDVKFRGVAKHLAYLLGWGYGTNQPDQGDRGEVLRISLPGEPTNFVPEHYFIVGTQGDPIIGGGPCAGGFALMKVARAHILVGTGRANFGVDKLDPAYGMASSRLHAEVNGEMHFWSLSGPRSTNGGPSEDLSFPLKLDGDVPDPIADDTLTENGFAYYDATAGEVVFVFGRWAYVLHLKDGVRRWSYRPFAVPLVNAGLLYIGGNEGLANITAHLEPGAVSYIEPTYAPGDGAPKVTIPWNIIGDLEGTEKGEVWMRSSVPGSAWRRRFAGSPVAGTTTVTVDGFWTTYEIALRLTAGAFPATGYESADPTNWPAVSRTTITTGGEIATLTLGKWQRFDTTTQGYDVLTLDGPGLEAPADLVGLSYRAEKTQDNGVTWLPVASGLTRDMAMLACVFANSDSLLARDFRLRPEGPDGAGAWAYMGSRIVAPEPPAVVTPGGNSSDGANDHNDFHEWTWLAPNAVAGEVPADGPYQYRGRHTDGPSFLGPYGLVVDVAAGVHTTPALSPPVYAGDYQVPGVDPSTSGSRSAELEVRVKLASGDVSPWKVASQFEP